MPFGLSMGGSGGGAALRRTSRQLDSQQLKRLTAAAAVATAGAAGVTCFNAHRHKLPVLPVRPSKEQQQHLLQIPRELAEVICGAVGEIVQVAVLYPLDTIKVSYLTLADAKGPQGSAYQPRLVVAAVGCRQCGCALV